MNPLTVRRALAFQTECIAELRRAKRQEVLRQKFEAAGGDLGRQAAALRLAALPALCEVVPSYGFDASPAGVCESLISLLRRAAESSEVLGPHRTLAGLMCPPLKDELPTLDGAWAEACLKRMTCKGTDILAEYLASLFEFAQSCRRCADKDDGCAPGAFAQEASAKVLPESQRCLQEEAETMKGFSLHVGLRPSSSKADPEDFNNVVSFLAFRSQPSPLKEEHSKQGTENGLDPLVTLEHVVDVQLNCISFQMKSLEEGRNMWPQINPDVLGRVLKGMTLARCLALQEELLTRLKDPKFQELARRVYGGSNRMKQLTSHMVLAFPFLAPVLAKYGIEVSACGLQVLPCVMVFFKGMKQVEENTARIATLLSAGVSPNLRAGLSRTSPEVLQAVKELAMEQENLEAFRAALHSEPVRGLSHWICIKQSGLAKTTPDVGSFPNYINQGCLLQVFEALPAPDRSLFLRLEDARGWVRALGIDSTSGAISGGGGACCVRLAPRAGRLWQVVGGASLGGIKIRKGKELTSPVLGNSEREVRLETGAKVCELELVGERLHYEKVQGIGPDLGWLSIFFKGSALVQVVDWMRDVPEQLAERPDGSGDGQPAEQ